jgi:hypothetical protein
MRNIIKLKAVCGIAALIAVIIFSVTTCSDSEPEPAHVHEWGAWTPTIYPNKILGGWEIRICKINSAHYEQRRVTRPSDKTIKPENFSSGERWTKEISVPVTATLDYVIEKINNEDVCKISVYNAVNTTRWKANVHYYYTAKANATYEYKFEAWTEGSERTLGIQCYYDFNNSESVMAGDVIIDTSKKEYIVRGGTIPKGGIRSLQFHCADQTGTFYVKMISIEEYVLEELPQKDRWSKVIDSGSTVTLEYEYDEDEDVCKIIVEGNAMPEGPGNWNAWRARVNYLFTAKANTHYTFKFTAWIDEDDPEDERYLDIQYYYDDAKNIYRDTSDKITKEEKEYKLTTVQGVIVKGGVRELRFQCANQVGTFYVKDLEIIPFPKK